MTYVSLLLVKEYSLYRVILYDDNVKMASLMHYSSVSTVLAAAGEQLLLYV